MQQTTATHHSLRIHVNVLSQEGDEKEISINPLQHCSQLLHEGLEALYGHPGPNPDEYDLVLNGKIIEPLTQTVADAGITEGTVVHILPKKISRGEQ